MENSLTPKIEFLYIVPTYQCNLKCPHCDIRSKKDNFDRISFLKTLSNYKNVPAVIFGGEPTLYPDRIQMICDCGNVESISTNLINLNDELINLIKDNQLSIATSWNPNRFNGTQYDTWVKNLSVLAKNNLSAKLLITLTQDLIEYDINDLISKFEHWSSTGGLTDIQFEPLLDYSKNQQFYDAVDQWLFVIDQKWSNDIVPNHIVHQLKNWKFNCSATYTLQPNGMLTRGCPQDTGLRVNTQCFDCHYSAVCQPCRLQQYCTFPKKLYQKYYE